MNNIIARQITSVVTSGIIGQAVGDALGVPVEFQSRESLQKNPVSDMRSFGTHNQPAGTWSDDTSLALCLAESVAKVGIDYHDQASRFVGWYQRAEWTPYGVVFDIGGTTREAISRLDEGVEPTEAGPTHEHSCGNGSLMRILPIALYMAFADVTERIETVMLSSRVTHGHPRCQLSCAFFAEVIAAMVQQKDIVEAVSIAQSTITSLINEQYPDELPTFSRILSADLNQIK